MYNWLYFYIPALAIAFNLPAVTHKVCRKDNIEIIGKRYYYSYTDWNEGEIHTVSFYRGQRENALVLLYSIAMTVLVFLAFLYANHWWVALIALASGTLLSGLRAGKLCYGSILYFFELIVEPILLFFAYYFLLSAHN